MDKATGAEINHLDLTSRVRLNQNVFRLQIAMDQVKIMNKVQSVQNLLRHFLQSRNVEIVLFLNFSVVLGILVEIISEKLCHNEKMFFMIEIVNDLQEILRVEVITVSANESEKFDFIDTLIKVVLIVLNNLHAHHLFSVDVIALDSFGESSGS